MVCNFFVRFVSLRPAEVEKEKTPWVVKQDNKHIHENHTITTVQGTVPVVVAAAVALLPSAAVAAAVIKYQNCCNLLL